LKGNTTRRRRFLIGAVDWDRVPPSELDYCEECGASLDFCDCPYNQPYEPYEEEEWDF
jgi:hypothetical protein